MKIFRNTKRKHSAMSILNNMQLQTTEKLRHNLAMTKILPTNS